MDVRGWLSRGQEVDAGDFAELTPVKVEQVAFDSDGQVVVSFAGDLDERTQAAVRRRIMSSSPAEEKARTDAAVLSEQTAEWASTTNVGALAAQVDALTRQVTALTKLAVDFNMGTTAPAPTLAPSKVTEAPRTTTRPK